MKITLSKEELDPDPIKQFAIWFKEACSKPEISDPEAFCLSTIDVEGYPNGRMLLLKGYGPEGFLFFSNCNSKKGRALKNTPKASMTFFWNQLERQVRLQGDIVVIPDKEADSYFKNRHRSHQLGSVASLQSEVMESRDILEQRIREIDLQFQGQDIPRPQYWWGYRLVPRRIEFWQRREDEARMNDRFAYTFDANNSWKINALYP